MEDVEKQQKEEYGGVFREDDLTEKLTTEGKALLDFDMLCSTVALQTTHGLWRDLETFEGDEEGGGGGIGGDSGGDFRMWEGDVLDCFDDRRVALESVCCPCYRFGKNMRRVGCGHCYVQGIVYIILVVSGFANLVAYLITKRHCFLYLALAFTVSVVAFMGFFRTHIKKKFHIKGSDSFLDDCLYYLICPCCTLCQESRTLEMNNVQNGTWHGRGDTICIGSYSKMNGAVFEIHPPLVSTTSPEPCTMLKSGDNTDDL